MNSVFAECFEKVEDPRLNRTRKHLLIDILAITLFGIMAGAQTFDEIQMFGDIHHEWLKKYLELPNGIPSHDTINRVLSMLNPEVLQKSFLEWIGRIKGYVNENVIAIDGKTIKGSHQNSKGLKALHILNAYSCANGLSLGQMKVDGKTNEITVIPKLLEQLMLEGAIVTIDAMGCQKDIAEAIVNKGADYILAVKGNHRDLAEAIKDTFDFAKNKDFNDGLIANRYTHEINGDHGRIESRTVETLSDYTIESQIDLGAWKNIRSIVKVSYTDALKDHTEVRYFISSLSNTAVKQIAHSIRSHWQIENNLHWVLDVAFREDESRIRHEVTAQNFSWFRKMALALLDKDGTKLPYRRKMYRNSMNPDNIINGLMG